MFKNLTGKKQKACPATVTQHILPAVSGSPDTPAIKLKALNCYVFLNCEFTSIVPAFRTNSMIFYSSSAI